MGSHEISGANKAVTSRAVLIMRSVTAYDPKVKSQVSFANAIGVGKVTISKWIAGDAMVTVRDVVNICTKFKANPIYLILGTGDMFLTQPKEMKNSSIEMTLAELNLRLSEMEIAMKRSGVTTEPGKKKR